MTQAGNTPSSKTIILVGLVGCFLTSIVGITGAMLLSGWGASGGWSEWTHRLALGYPCSCLVVFSLFPVMVPRLNRFFEKTCPPGEESTLP